MTNGFFEFAHTIEYQYSSFQPKWPRSNLTIPALSTTQRSELTSGKGNFPTKAARREESDARTVLAVKGSLRRAKTGRARPAKAGTPRSGPFRRKYRCDGRLRRENHPDPAVCSDATIDQRST